MRSGNPNCAHIFLIGLLCACANLALGQTVLAESQFETGLEGWFNVGDPSMRRPEWRSTGGNPGGCIRVTDAGEGVYAWFQAPARFLGNKSAAYGHSLSYDLQTAAPGPDDSSANVVLMGREKCIVAHVGPRPAPAPGWTRYTVWFDLRIDWHLDTMSSPPATPGDIQEVLAELNVIQIRAEYDGSPDRVSLDNVVLQGDECFLRGDLDNDGAVGLRDLTILLAAFGTMCP